MEKDRENGNTVLLTVIGVATLLVALVGATFAYFSATIKTESKESVILTTQKPAGLTYAGGTLPLLNAQPGNQASNTFTVQNTDANITQTYDLDLVIEALAEGEKGFTVTDLTGTPEENSEDADKVGEQLFLTITAQSSVEGNTITLLKDTYNLTDGTVAIDTPKFVDNQVIAPGETHTYTVTLDFKDWKFKQDNNQGATLRAHIDISDPRSVSTNAPGAGA